MSRLRTSKIEEKIAYEIFRSCRLCGAGAGYKMPIVQNVDLDGDVPLTQKIRECVQIEVHQEDKMPPLICELCVDKVNDFYEFSEMCKQTNMKTRSRLGLPPQTMPRGAPDAGDCILGVTETLFSNDDSNEPIIKHKQAKQSKSKKETSDKVKIKSENNRSTKPSPEEKRPTRRSLSSPTNILTLRNRNSKDQKDQPKKKSSEPLKSILKKEKIKEEEILITPKSKRGRERESRSDFPVKRVKIEVSPSTSKSKFKSPPSRAKSPPRSTTKSPPKSRTKSPPRPRAKSPEQHICRWCKKSYDNKRNLSNHIRTHQKQNKNTKIKKSPPVPESKSKEKSEKIQAKVKNEIKQNTYNCSCGKEYLTYRNLCKHQITCTRKKKKDINPKLLSQVRPLQIRIARCDPLLKRNYSISEITEVFGLDKNCIYPYLKIKNESNPGNNTMVRFDDEIQNLINDTDYIHWDSDTSIENDEIGQNKVSNLSTLSLKVIFSTKYLGRVRKKKRKIKKIKDILQKKDNFDTIDSFDDVHDLERMNDNSFDLLFGNDYQKILPDMDDKEGNVKDNDKNVNKEENSDKEVNNDKEDVNKVGNNDNEVTLREETEDKDLSVNKEENNDIDNVKKEDNNSEKLTLSKEENNIIEDHIHEESSTDITSSKEINNEKDSIKKEISNKSEDRLNEEETNGKIEDASRNQDVNGFNIDTKEINSKEKEENELTERQDSKFEDKKETNGISEDTVSKDNEGINDQKDIEKDSISESKDIKTSQENVTNLEEENQKSIENNSNLQKSDLIRNEIEQIDKPKIDISNNFHQIHKINDLEYKKSIELEISERQTNLINTKIELNKEITDLISNKQKNYELITENDLLGEKGTESRDSMELDESILEDNTDDDTKMYNTDSEKAENIMKNDKKSSGKDENIMENDDMSSEKEENIMENDDMSSKKDENIMENDDMSSKKEENIMEIDNRSSGKAENNIENDKNSEKSEINSSEDKNILDKVNDESDLINGDDSMDDQKLMDELNAQIGEDILDQHMSLDDFSEDDQF